MKKNKRNILPLLLLSNLFPLYGVAREDWPFFLVLYIFWFEMLIVTFFDELKMFFSQGGERGWDKARNMFTFALVKSGIFCFYMIFIVIFIGFMATSKDQFAQMARALGFRDVVFNIAILNFLAYNFIEFLLYYILNGKYQTSKASDHYHIIDGRQVVVHVVVVLGAFLSGFVLERFPNNYYYSNLVLVVLFIAVKTIADLVAGKRAPEEEPMEKYI